MALCPDLFDNCANSFLLTASHGRNTRFDFGYSQISKHSGYTNAMRKTHGYMGSLCPVA
jgi:hypothetical protein